MIKKLMGQLHLWLGLASGLVVLILGVTGCLYTFDRELKDLVYADRIFVDAKTPTPLPFNQLTSLVQQHLGADKPISRIEVQPGSNRTYFFRAYKFNNEDASTYADQFAYSRTVYVNPYTGKIQYDENSKWEFFSIVLSLHYDLMLGHTGHLIVSWSTVIFVITLLTGLVLWWPTNKAAARKAFWFRWKASTKWKRKNYDLHNIPGFYSLLIALVLGLTGLIFGFTWFRNSVKSVANVGQETPAPKPVVSDTMQRVRRADFQTVFQTVQQLEPQLEKFLFVLPEAKEGTISVRCYHNPANFARQNTLLFDQYTGQLLANRTYSELSAGDKLLMANYDLHVGRILGVSGMILAFLGSLIAASLPITGFIIWWNRRKKVPKSKTARQKNRQVLAAR